MRFFILSILSLISLALAAPITCVPLNVRLLTSENKRTPEPEAEAEPFSTSLEGSECGLADCTW
jgi:hypothetical protein